MAVPVCVMFNGFIETYVQEYSHIVGLSPLWPIILAISIIVIITLATVGWQIHKVLQVDPAKACMDL